MVIPNVCLASKSQREQLTMFGFGYIFQGASPRFILPHLSQRLGSVADWISYPLRRLLPPRPGFNSLSNQPGQKTCTESDRMLFRHMIPTQFSKIVMR